MKNKLKAIMFALATASAVGCVNSANTPGVTYQVEELKSNQRYLVEEPLGVQQSATQPGRFNSQLIFLADQMERNVDRKSLENTFIVTSLSNLNRLSETSGFGRLVAENVIHELQVRKWKVFEVRLTKDVVINETGEFSLSRDVRKLKDIYKVGGVVTGTYSVAGNHIIVNTRVIDIASGIVVSTGQVHIPVNAFTEALLFDADGLAPMKIVGDTPFSCRENQTCWNGEPYGPRKDAAP